MCPLHIQSPLRARELAAEAAGLQVALNSDGVNVQRNAEKAGLAPTTIPVNLGFLFNGNRHASDENKSKW